MKASGEAWLTPTQACRTLGITVQELYALIDSGRLPAYRIGSRIRPAHRGRPGVPRRPGQRRPVAGGYAPAGLAGTRPRRPAWKSSKAWTISERVFITNGP